MATNFVAADYREGLQTLLDRHDVPVTVKAFTLERDYQKMADGPVAELELDEFPVGQVGVPRMLQGTLRAGLLVMVKLNEDEAEEKAFELACDVATALVDETDPEDTEQEPVFAAGPILVTGIDRDSPEGALQNRVVAYLVTFEQDWVIRRTVQPTEPVPPRGLLLGRAPNVGPGHEDDYRTLVELPEPEPDPEP